MNKPIKTPTHLSIQAQEDIVTLDVTMNNVVMMEIIQGSQTALGDARYLSLIEHRFRNNVSQWASLQEFHDDPERLVHDIGVKKVDNVVMV